MGGVTELIDPLNMGEQVRYVQLGKEVEGSKNSSESFARLACVHVR